MRAEWERLAKESKDRDRRRYQDARYNEANSHYSRFDSRGKFDRDDDPQWEKLRRNTRASRRRQKYRENAANAASSDDTYERAKRVQENLHFADSFRNDPNFKGNAGENWQRSDKNFSFSESFKNDPYFKGAERRNEWRDRHEEVLHNRETYPDYLEWRRKRAKYRNILVTYVVFAFTMTWVYALVSNARRQENIRKEEEQNYLQYSRQKYDERISTEEKGKDSENESQKLSEKD